MEIVYQCPSLEEECCTWFGEAKEVVPHFTTVHPKLVVKSNRITLGITQEYRRNLLMLHQNETYLIQIHFSCGVIVINLRYLGSHITARENSFYLEVGFGDIAFTNRETDFSPVKNTKDGILIDVNILKTTNPNTDYLICTIHIEKKLNLIRKNSLRYMKSSVKPADSFSLRHILPDEDFFKEENELDEMMEGGHEIFRRGSLRTACLDDVTENKRKLELIKCTNCSELMTDPIFLCPSGHNICIRCRQTRNICKECNGEVLNMRNDDLEELSRNVEQQCRFSEIGCPRTMTGKEIRKHEATCAYSSYRCPVCEIRIKYIDMHQHIRIVHASMKIDTRSRLYYPLGPDQELVIFNEAGIFYCQSRIADTNAVWSVKFCGGHKPFFRCEIEAMGKKEQKQLFRLTSDGTNKFRCKVPLKELKFKIKNARLKLVTLFNYDESVK